MVGRLLLMMLVCGQLTGASRRHDDQLPSAVWLNRPPIQGDDRALVNTWGHVTVVSLVQANSAYSRQQAKRLDELRVSLTSDVISGQHVGLHVVGINSRHWPASLMTSELTSLVNFTVYQSTSRDDHWSRLGGHKDDVFVYDRWGNLAYYVPFPQSYVANRYVEAAILSAMHDGPCNRWPTLVAPSVNCSNSTNGTTSRDVIGGQCASYDEQRCASVTSRHRQSSSAELRMAERCCRHLESARRHHHRHHHRHHVTARRCLCLQKSAGGLHSCMCRSNATATHQPTHSNCFWSLTASQLAEQCSWSNTQWSDDSKLCSWHVELPPPSSDSSDLTSWSWQDPPSPYGQHAGLSATSAGFCRPHGQPLIWPQAAWSWPLSASPAAGSVSWSWRMELGADQQRQQPTDDAENSRPHPSAVTWVWPKHDEQHPGLGEMMAPSSSWSWPEAETAVGGVGGWNVKEWSCRESEAVVWAGDRPWQQQTVECRWQGRVSATTWWSETAAVGRQWADEVEWRKQLQQQPSATGWGDAWRQQWGQWSTDSWRTGWRPTEWKWVSVEAASALWRQAPNASWSERAEWNVVDGWSWNGQAVVDGCSTTDGCVRVVGWLWDHQLVITAWQARHQRDRWRQDITWSQWAWDRREGRAE